MSSLMTASESDLCGLAAIVTADRDDLPPHGLPLSLLRDLMGQIRCDFVQFQGFDSGRRDNWFIQGFPDEGDEGESDADLDQAHWRHYWDSAPCSYPDRTGDLRSVLKIADFYSDRQWHSTGMYADVYRPQDFSERDRALLTVMRPHLHQAYLDAERRRTQGSPLTPRQADLLRLVADGHTNAQIARRLGLSEGTVRTHLENIYGRLQVSSRTAAVLRAFPDLVAQDR
jgi:DNA-binding CsgD family transcriptional regulator